jgi:hypothetical protein
VSTASLALCCTDRGQHPWTLLGDLTISDGGLLRANVGAVYGVTAERRKDECVWLDDIRRPSYRAHARCPRCRRHIQWRGEHARKIVESSTAAGRTQFDISHG